MVIKRPARKAFCNSLAMIPTFLIRIKFNFDQTYLFLLRYDKLFDEKQITVDIKEKTARLFNNYLIYYSLLLSILCAKADYHE